MIGCSATPVSRFGRAREPALECSSACFDVDWDASGSARGRGVPRSSRAARLTRTPPAHGL
eukprot:2625164-Alexandrium_andersonii.AAC.1